MEARQETRPLLGVVSYPKTADIPRPDVCYSTSGPRYYTIPFMARTCLARVSFFVRRACNARRLFLRPAHRQDHVSHQEKHEGQPDEDGYADDPVFHNKFLSAFKPTS
jgi:hypothetical protein